MSVYTGLRGTRSRFLDLTGFSVEEFEHYLPAFGAAHAELYPLGRPGQHQQPASQGAPEPLAGMEDRLLFIWLHDRAHRPPAELASLFGLNPQRVNVWARRLQPVLQLASSTLSVPRLGPNDVKFLQCLNALEVDYLVIGGHAVAFHGYRRPILDLDVFVATDAMNARKLMRVLQEVGHGAPPQASDFFQMPERVIRIGQPPFTIERFAAEDRMIHLGTPPTQFEVLTSISAVTFTECYPERVTGLIDGVPVQVIGLAQLRRNKRASIRAKDADDLAHLS